jgi:hypothetical protein
MSYTNPFGAAAAVTAAPVTATGPCPSVPRVALMANAARSSRALYQAVADTVLDGVGDGDEAVPLVKIYPTSDEYSTTDVITVDGYPTANKPSSAWAVTVTCGLALSGLVVYARVYTGMEGDDLTYVDTPAVACIGRSGPAECTAGGDGTAMLFLPDILQGSMVELRCTYVNVEAHTLIATEAAAIQVVFERIGPAA